jgi:hypothetical protein
MERSLTWRNIQVFRIPMYADLTVYVLETAYDMDKQVG